MEPPPTTVRYRLLIAPELGTGLGNAVHVGLDVLSADENAPLVFTGLPRRIAEIRDELHLVRTPDGSLFGKRTHTTAHDLQAVMRSPRLKRFAPELETGGEILGEGTAT